MQRSLLDIVRFHIFDFHHSANDDSFSFFHQDELTGDNLKNGFKYAPQIPPQDEYGTARHQTILPSKVLVRLRGFTVNGNTTINCHAFRPDLVLLQLGRQQEEGPEHVQ